ncbi:Serine carboxypeptidase-like 50 [Striga hermonthica]|uniref:Carboxypeptidase n=1 Tax=Striga hermonthica TaxID=68872 RepID=A0A9N7NSZ9_STRHE|nr:Serine carboxypeptidase-like 50 [Striga hermonthica]
MKKSPLLPPQLFFNFLLIAAAAALRHPAAGSAAHFPKEALPTKSGYLTVNSTTGSAIFYTYYEAQNPHNPQTAILIWLQGGPGCSSMLANFYELGPWLMNPETLTLDPNPGSWNTKFGLLFLDNPIGSGFSIAPSFQEIPRNQHDVAKHLFTAIKKFISLDSSFKTRPLYITGESYAGKYVPGLGYYILKKNPFLPAEERVNLAGLAIGNGLTHPATQVGTHAENAYNLGLINDKQKAFLERIQFETIGFVKSGKWGEATDARSRVLKTLQNMTGLATLYDFRRLIPYQDDVVAKFLNNVDIKKALGVNESLVFEVCSDLVEKALKEDVMKSVKYMVEFLVKNMRVLLYQGQCDLRDGVVSTLAWVKKMRWDGIREFLEADRKVWRVDEKLAGYVQRWENLSHAVVVNAGHLVPTDQPVNSRVMIEDWVLGKGSFGEGKEIEEVFCDVCSGSV